MRLLTDSMVFKDDPDHKRLRSLVNKAFTPHVVQRLAPDVERVTSALLDRMAREPVVDLVSAFALPLLQRLRREGFENEGDAARISDRFTAAAAGQVGATDYIARIDGEAAGSSMLFVSDGRALLGGMATLPAFRTRGLQGAMIRHRVARASELGCYLAVSTTVPANRSGLNLQRHGFAVTFTMATLRRDAPQRS